MRLLDRLERRFRRYAVPNLTLLIIIGQVFAFIQCRRDIAFLEPIALLPHRVLEGEVWRLVTFIFLPVSLDLLWFAIGMMVFHFFGSVMEQTWGAFKYNVYVFSGLLITVGVSFVFPYVPATNVFIFSAVFLAFAWLYPDFVLRLWFVLPVKARWLATFTWIINIYSFIKGPNPIRLMVLAGVSNFLLFFGNDIRLRIRSRARRIQQKAVVAAAAKKPKHECVTCGATDKSDPTLEFRYCSKCEGALCYCENHLREHQHIGKADA
jgi:hypothetical protein